MSALTLPITTNAYTAHPHVEQLHRVVWETEAALKGELAESLVKLVKAGGDTFLDLATWGGAGVALAVAAHPEMGHVLLALLLVIVAAKIGEVIATSIKAPIVLGELSIGIILGNIYFLTGWDFFDFLRTMPFLKIMASFGAIILLLSVGLHIDFPSMARAGLSSFLVAFWGAMAPFGLGFLVCLFLLPDTSLATKVAMGVTLCATSVGVTVRVFQELGKMQTPEARIVVGAAIIDDVLVLLGIAVLSGLIYEGAWVLHHLIITIVAVLAFLALVIVMGLRFNRAFGGYITENFSEAWKLFIIVVTCLSFVYLSQTIGLATIVGAFGAGVLLQDVKIKDFEGKGHSMEVLVRPAYLVLVPFFFIIAGAQVHLESFLDKTAVLLAISIAGAALLGKFSSCLLVIEKGVKRLHVGVGMLPKAEVTLVLASIGRDAGLLADYMFSAVVIMVTFDALIPPIILKLVLSRVKKIVPSRPLVPYVSDETRKVAARLKRLGRR